MPFITPGPSTVSRTRVLINGAPNSGKTTSLLTFPGPRVILSYPGEGGYDSIPDHDPLTTKLVYVSDKLVSNPNSSQIITEVEKATVQALQVPGLQTFCGDGLHKLMAYVMDALSGGEYFAGSEVKTESAQNTSVLDPRVWNQAERWLANYLAVVKQSAVPYVVFTAWDADKQERKAQKVKGEKWSDMPTSRMPALPGSMGRTVLGEFSVVVHASKGVIDAQKGVKGYRWQTKSDGDVMGAGIKTPVEIGEKIPKFVKADWRELAAYLGVMPAKENV